MKYKLVAFWLIVFGALFAFCKCVSSIILLYRTESAVFVFRGVYKE